VFYRGPNNHLWTSWWQQSVLTNNNNNARTGFYPEFQLSPFNVNASAIATFGKIFSWQTDGQIYAQPLYVHGLQLADGTIHNVVYVATETNHVYSFDADSHSMLWERTLGDPVLWGVGGCGRKNLWPKTGITSTPAIDLNTNIIYVVARTRDMDGVVRYRLHALNLGDGQDVFGGPVIVSTAGFDAEKHLNRPGLLLSGGLVYIAFGSECDTDPYHGWIFGYDQADLNQTAVFNSTPTGERGGIWQAGRGLAADAVGDVYLMTGNGTVDFGHQDVGESLLRLSHDLRLEDWFTPADHACWNQNDLDLGSSGPLLLPSATGDTEPFHLVGGGKPGVLYLLSSGNLGGSDHFHPLDEILATKPLAWVGVPCAAILLTGGSDTHHIHGGPVLWQSRQRDLIYNLGENDSLKAFEIVGNKIIFVATSKFQAPPGMPGGILSVSGVPEDPNSTIVWATVPLQGDAVEHIVRGILIAFQASPNGSDIPLLWHSEMNAARDTVGLFAKYVPPTVADGKVFVASFGDPADPDNADNGDPTKRRIGQLHVYGLLRAP
jgi:outer membrane protein assembly factor BamB